MTRVLFLWLPADDLRWLLADRLAAAPGVELVFPPDSEPATLLRLASQAQVMVGWRPTPELLAAAESLELFINPGAGVQALVGLLRDAGRGITLVNDHGNAYATAQHAVALLLALTNKVIPHHNWLAVGEWRRGDDDAASVTLRGKTVGLLGYGHVNRLVHRFLSGFDLRFAALRRDWSARAEPAPTPVDKLGPAEADRLFEQSDIVMVSVPETRETTGLVDSRRLELLGREGMLVNYARGAVVVEADLYRALKERSIAGAAIDTWYSYRPEADAQGRKRPYHLPFHELDNVVLSPHRAASPVFGLERWDGVVENIRRCAAGRRDFVNVVDLERGY
ncbi:MAG: NAD(P)-dependent oxidoreductase [bacterium]